MYKIPSEVLEMFRDQLRLTSDLLDIAYKGGKSHPRGVADTLENNVKLLKLIKDNYGV